MGGVVSEVGEIGQGIISGVDEGLTQLDDAIPQEAKIAAAIYLASQGLPVGAEGAGFVGTTGSAIEAAEASQLSGLTGGFTGGAVATPVATGSVLATELPAFGTTNAGFTLPAIPPEVSAVSNANSVANAVSGGAASVPSAVTTAGEMTAQQTAEMIAKEQAASTGLLGSVGSALGNLSTAQQIGLGAAALGATGALGGSTPTSSTTTSSIDPDIKAAFLRNLGEARETAAGLGTRQFAPYAEYNLGMVQQYMNPYENTVVQNTLADIERARQGQISAEGARATAAGAFGGTRQAVTRSLVDEAALRNAGNLAAQLRQSGFAQAQNLGLSQQQMMQQYEQQKLDAQRNLGLERLNVSQGALSLQPARIGESTSTPIYRNQAVSGLGGALGGAQLGKLIGGTANPEYAGYGAGIGGLLGFL
jgi:hypothetical protein